MPIYKLTISPHIDEADRASGYAIADSEAEARALVGDPPHLKVHSMCDGMQWPGKPDEVAYWLDPFGHSVVPIASKWSQ